MLTQDKVFSLKKRKRKPTKIREPKINLNIDFEKEDIGEVAEWQAKTLDANAKRDSDDDDFGDEDGDSDFDDIFDNPP